MNALRKDLRASTAEGTATSVMVGIGENYFPAFVLAASGSQLACGLVSTVPVLVGGILQLVSLWLVPRLGSYRRWVVCCALVQAAVFAPLLAAAVMGAIPVVWVFALAAVYWAAGMACGPAWNAWVETLAPPRLHARYFARRTLVSQWGVAAGFVLGGIALQAGAQDGRHLYAFALLFFVAGGARFVSAGLLSRQREPVPPPKRMLAARPRAAIAPLNETAEDRKRRQHEDHATGRRSSPAAVFGMMRTHLGENLNGRLLIYLLATQAAVQIAGPYFTPFMLGRLAISYYRYVILICASFVAKIIFLPAIGKAVDRLGPRRVLWLSGVGVSIVPAMWLASDSFGYLIAVQACAGAAWAGFDLATLLLFFQTISAEKRVGVLTFFNFANAAAIVAGSAVGGTVLAVCNSSREAYLALFVLSTAARAVALLLLVRLPQHVAIAPQPARPAAPVVLPQPASRQGRLAAGSPSRGPHWTRTAPASRPSEQPARHLPG